MWVHMLDRGSRAVNNISANQFWDLGASRVFFFDAVVGWLLSFHRHWGEKLRNEFSIFGELIPKVFHL